jgi:hypothetical protein
MGARNFQNLRLDLTIALSSEPNMKTSYLDMDHLGNEILWEYEVDMMKIIIIYHRLYSE